MKDSQKKKGVKNPAEDEKRFRENKNLFRRFSQNPKQGGNMPRALGGHR